jgi:hypothetical protein
MAPEIIANIAWAAVGVGGLLFVFQFIVIPALVDTFRERLFSIRRQMFLYMADGHIAPDDPAYVRVRTIINGLLRFAERLTFLRVVLLSAVAWPEMAISPPFEEVLLKVQNETARRRMLEFHLRVQVAIVEHLLVSSPIAWIVGIVMSPVLVILLGIGGGIRRIRRDIRRLPNKIPSQMRGIESQAEALACAG